MVVSDSMESNPKIESRNKETKQKPKWKSNLENGNKVARFGFEF